MNDREQDEGYEDHQQNNRHQQLHQHLPGLASALIRFASPGAPVGKWTRPQPEQN